MSRVVSKKQPLQHYKWRDNCDRRTLVAEESLSVKIEAMPAGSTEVKHYHQQAQQFFYILKGTATFELKNTFVEINKGEGIQINAGEAHRILNNGSGKSKFILCS